MHRGRETRCWVIASPHDAGRSRADGRGPGAKSACHRKRYGSGLLLGLLRMCCRARTMLRMGSIHLRVLGRRVRPDPAGGRERWRLRGALLPHEIAGAIAPRHRRSSQTAQSDHASARTAGDCVGRPTAAQPGSAACRRRERDGLVLLLPMRIGVSWARVQLGRGGEASLPTKNVPGPAAPVATASTPRRWKPLRSVRSGV
jgi:hypothetical protein